MSTITIRDLTKRFVSDSGKTMTAVDAVSIEIASGEFISLLGPSGCGKTTILRIVAGLETQESGDVLVDGERIVGPSGDRTVVFQSFALFPWLSVLGNVRFGLEMKGWSKARANEVARHYVNLVGLSGFEDYDTSQLSGGMQQRVALARAFAVQPRVLLMDEPFGALDSITRAKMQDELLNIWQTEPRTIIFVTHSISEALRLSDRVFVMTGRPGRVAAIMPITEPRPRDQRSPALLKLAVEANRWLANEPTEPELPASRPDWASATILHTPVGRR